MKRTIEYEPALARIEDMQLAAAARRLLRGERLRRGVPRSVRMAIPALALVAVCAVPAGALAAGRVSSNSSGDITYDGDSGDNVLTVTASPVSPSKTQL